MEELKGRRVLRSASAPALAQDDFDETESEVTDRRESGWTMNTEDTRATSIRSSSHSRTNTASRVSFQQELKQRSNLAEDGISPSLQSLPEATESIDSSQTPLVAFNGDDPFAISALPEAGDLESPPAGDLDSPPSPSPVPSAPLRPFNPFAAGLMSQIQSIKRSDGEENEDEEEPTSPASRPFNPMAALHAQLKGRVGSPSDEDESASDSSKPTRPAFLSDINSLEKDTEGTLSTNASRFPFLAGIGAGSTNLKPANARTLADEPSQPNMFGFFKPTEMPAGIKGPRKIVNYQASAKVRQLHWDKINELKATENTVWSFSTNQEMENEWAEKLKQLNIWSQMESTFSSQEAKLQIGLFSFHLEHLVREGER